MPHLIATCADCRTPNRVPVDHVAGAHHCGRCGFPLASPDRGRQLEHVAAGVLSGAILGGAAGELAGAALGAVIGGALGLPWARWRERGASASRRTPTRAKPRSCVRGRANNGVK